MIPFNKPIQTYNELIYIKQAIESGRVSGDGFFTKKVHQWFKDKYKYNHVLMTTSCTDALEMCVHLLNIDSNDEIIMPSYTFVSTALPFVMAGAQVKFCDSSLESPHQCIDSIKSLISKKTKAIVVVHYAGMVLDMDEIVKLCKERDIFLIEDAAQAIDSYYMNQPAGSFGDLATFSFHESKNIICGEGGLLVIKDEALAKRAEIIREKGTNRSEFFRGEVNKYGWVDVGSSHLPSDVLAAYLLSQLEELDLLQLRRLQIWNTYYDRLTSAGYDYLLSPNYVGHNGHIFYLLIDNRSDFIKEMREKGIHTTFHYQSLHNSDYFKSQYTGPRLDNADRYSESLVRLPIYSSLTNYEVDYIIESTISVLKAR